MPRATPPRRRSALRAGRGTQALGALAVGATLATVGLEWARVWRRGSAPVPSETDHLLSAGRTATRETLAVMREGYRAGADRENAVFTMLAAFTLTFGGARATTMMIRRGRARGVLGNFIVGDRHIHHFVPGMLLALVSGGAAIATRGDTGERWLAVPFGAGAAL